jgi:hypothetical protein
MNSLNVIYVDQLVRVLRQDMERERIRREQLALVASEGPIAKSRKFVGSSLIGVGKVIQGQSNADAKIDLDPTTELPLKLAR